MLPSIALLLFLHGYAITIFHLEQKCLDIQFSGAKYSCSLLTQQNIRFIFERKSLEAIAWSPTMVAHYSFSLTLLSAIDFFELSDRILTSALNILTFSFSD